MSERRAKAGMKFDCIFENELDFIDIDYIHLNKVVRYENRPLGTIPEIHDENAKIVINNYLSYLISKSNKCSNCMLKHIVNDNTCFFASACFPNYDYYIEKEEKE